ncbi:MAG: NIPSNAP family protein [Blastocatellales bacterium]
MKRRDVIKTGLAVGLTGAVGDAVRAAADANHYYELRTYQLRNDIKPERIQDFFKNHFMGAMKRHGIGPVGCFSVVSGLRSPALIVVIDHPTLGDMGTAISRLAGDKDFAKAVRDFEAGGELPYVRVESTLLRAFDAHPKMEIPEPSRQPRIFELRTYEAPNASGLRNKVDMFNQEEIKIFRDCGFATVFFGEAVVGANMPQLTYLVGFDSMAAREKAWDAFRVNPDWARIRNRPGWTNPEAVSNIHASFISPTAFSMVR